MPDGIYVALSGAIAQTMALENTANNVANVGSAGFQGSRPVFREVLAKAAKDNGQQRFVTVQRNAIDTSRGAVRATGRPLDVALPEGTYLAVSAPGGTRYTRAGSMRVNAEGTLETQTGHPVMGEGGAPLTVNLLDGEPAILSDGTVRQRANVIGRLSLVSFNDASSLRREGANLLAATAASGQAEAKDATVDIGVIEDSNGSVIGGMNDLIAASRAFEAFEKSIDAFRDADRSAATKVMGT